MAAVDGKVGSKAGERWRTKRNEKTRTDGLLGRWWTPSDGKAGIF